MKTKNSKFSRILVVLMIILLMIPALGSAAYAEGEMTAQPMTLATYAVSFDAVSSIKGNVDAYVSSTVMASSITSKITLQSAPLGSISYSNVSGVLPSTLTVYNQSYIKHLCSFPISSSKNYRIKIELTEKYNGKKTTATIYKTLTR